MYKLIKVTKVYDLYLNNYIKNNPIQPELSYSQQMQCLLNEYAGECDFCLKEMNKLGVETKLFYYNLPIMQILMKEKGTSSPFEAFLKVLKEEKPDVLFISDFFLFTPIELEKIRKEIPSKSKMVAWHFSGIPTNITDISKWFDEIYTGSNFFVEVLRQKGINAKLLYHSFNPNILNKIKLLPEKNVRVCFPGSISIPYHLNRLEMGGRLIEQGVPFIFAGSLYGCLNPKNLHQLGSYVKLRLKNKIPNLKTNKYYEKNLRENMIPSVFGLDYYQFMADNLVTINQHASNLLTLKDCIKGSGNMRMTEATGVGSCLLTDYREGNKDQFVPDYEIVEYKSTDELIEKAKWLIDNPKKAKEIGLAGQKKTLSIYTSKTKAEQLHSYLMELLK